MCNMNLDVSCKLVFIDYEILTLDNTYIFETLLVMFKKYKNIISVKPNHNTRFTSCISLPIPTTTLIKQSTLYNSEKYLLSRYL